jgi:CHASE2 domain-containing sensor protein
MLALTAQSSHVGPLIAALGFGLVIGVLGHLSRSRTLIVTGILIIGLVSSYFAFVLQPSGG